MSLLFHRRPEETKREVKPSAIFAMNDGDRRKLFARALLAPICAFLFLFGLRGMLFILHIKGTASDVQDIVKYLPVMPGRQYLLIQPLLPLSLS